MLRDPSPVGSSFAGGPMDSTPSACILRSSAAPCGATSRFDFSSHSAKRPAASRLASGGNAASFANAGVTWFEEPVSSDDLEGLRLLRDQGPAGMDITAGEYGYDLYYFRRMLDAGDRIASIDVNPFLLRQKGGVALDALVVLNAPVKRG